MDDQNKNLLLATALSFLVILVWYVFIAPPELDTPAPSAESAIVQTAPSGSIAAVPQSAGGADTSSASTPATEASSAPRLPILSPKLEGTISLLGGRVDDLSLRGYHETLDPNSPIVSLLSPVGSDNAYYALFGWAPGTSLTAQDVPGTDTLWSVESGETLTPETPVVLKWESPAGLIFRRQISIDEDFLFDIVQSVENPTQNEFKAAPYGIIARHGLPDLTNFFILHEGVVGLQNGTLIELEYDDVAEADVLPSLGTNGQEYSSAADGWVGFTDKYWMTTLIPPAQQPFEMKVLHQARSDIYQTQTIYPTLTIAAGEKITNASKFFAGAKEWEVIREYQNEKGIPKFLDSIDWGWFFFLTKPIFAVLHWLNAVIGNMGIAIIALTLMIKAVLFPLAYKSYVSMAKMKELQPQMEKLKEVAGDDKQKMQQEMMKLYKREKVNPASGCLPIVMQIPIFFSLYKVIFVTIELRHAAFFGPFQDLSAPDPTTILNLFGLLPLAAPEPGSIVALVFIGILPLLLGISMWLQQKLNPAPTDATQAMIFAYMPWIFMFMLGSFASGLVVYWIANNTITFTQQYLIMRSQGYKPDVFGNIRSSFKARTEKKRKK